MAFFGGKISSHGWPVSEQCVCVPFPFRIPTQHGNVLLINCSIRPGMDGGNCTGDFALHAQEFLASLMICVLASCCSFLSDHCLIVVGMHTVYCFIFQFIVKYFCSLEIVSSPLPFLEVQSTKQI